MEVDSNLTTTGNKKTTKASMNATKAKSTTVSKRAAASREKVLKATIEERDVLQKENAELQAQIDALTAQLSQTKVETDTKPPSPAPQLVNPFGGALPTNYVAKNAGPPPAKPLKAFRFYANEFREQVKEEHDSLTGVELNNILRNMWNELSEEDQIPYLEKEQEAITVYEQEKEKYDQHKEAVDRTNRAMMDMFNKQRTEAALKMYDEEMAKRKTQGPSPSSKTGIQTIPMPKQPRNAWNYYVMQRRAEMKSANKELPSVRELNTQLSESWKKLQRSKKKKDKDLLNTIMTKTAEDKKRYEREMAQYNAQVVEMRKKMDAEFEEIEKVALEQYALKEEEEAMVEEGKKASKEKALAVKQERKIAREKRAAKPKGPTRPRSAYIFFVKTNRATIAKEFPDKKTSEITSEVAARWNALSDTDKACYEKMAADDRVRYEKEKFDFEAKQ